MRIEWLMTCQAFTLRPDGRCDIVGAGFDTLFFRPGRVEVQFLARVAYTPDDQGHKVRNTWQSTNMTVMLDQEEHFIAKAAPSRLPGWETHTFLPARFGFQDAREGIGTYTMTIDDQVSQSLQVVLKRLPGS